MIQTGTRSRAAEGLEFMLSSAPSPPHTHRFFLGIQLPPTWWGEHPHCAPSSCSPHSKLLEESTRPSSPSLSAYIQVSSLRCSRTPCCQHLGHSSVLPCYRGACHTPNLPFLKPMAQSSHEESVRQNAVVGEGAILQGLDHCPPGVKVVERGGGTREDTLTRHTGGSRPGPRGRKGASVESDSGLEFA